MLRPRAAFTRPVPVLGAALLTAALGGTAHAAPAPAPATAKVVLKDVAFHRATTVVRVGGRVTWSWQDPYVTHNIHATGSRRFRGASARQKGTYTVRFARAGTYAYRCTLHPGMNGRIVVR